MQHEKFQNVNKQGFVTKVPSINQATKDVISKIKLVGTSRHGQPSAHSVPSFKNRISNIAKHEDLIYNGNEKYQNPEDEDCDVNLKLCR